MTAKVHDQDMDQDFAEIDMILEQAQLELHKDRCRNRKLRRNMNLSVIPENFAHVPSNEATLPPASLDVLQPDFGIREGHKRPNHRLQVLSCIAPMRWLRAYMSCVMAAHDGNYDVRRAVKGCSMMSGPDFAFSPARPPQHQVGYGD
ncbi:uncharacterized protein [Physcomitrium patens]|uniref:Uncharacterized protein n=1 Tax=Physcomitrium patens TaxID=3218 RepID=A9S032_PHYPA|nr:uncharacterized protein LOC112281943 [Physcomitrium patens]XP_024374790.1 uncharacterized protein LOC112281943 [Physcomitrium patens]PNR61867.1 hypothetical protein PHYPA_000291 [Physcomitrium patens]|eukprot:XP_024374781.1 uncharacterized protein LOC112281943 [Physcomitrella patens]